jgi:hypothetical protein
MNKLNKLVTVMAVTTMQQIFGGLYFVFTRCLKMSTGYMALSDFIINLTT